MSDFSDNDETDTSVEFNKAAAFIQTIHNTLSSNVLLEFYGLYKQSTCGNCNTTKPGIFNGQARAKWNAWKSLENVKNDDAMQLYIDKLTSIHLNWNQKSVNDITTSSWVCHSLPINEQEDHIPDEEKNAFDFIREGDCERLKLNLNKDNINCLDETGLGLIHWATDRNEVEILEYLLFSGADVNLQDIDLQTPLHYASSCGHLDCLKILIKFGGDKDIKNNEGQSCFDVAFNENVHMLLNS